MNNEKRLQQIRDAARYKYPDERIHFIDGAKWADQHPAWVSVEEELPRETGWYLVATPTLNSKIDVALWDGKWRRLVTITHWMPLPTPPVKKGGGEQ